jgi:sugar/nucleoside kinase (ribokinase family)
MNMDKKKISENTDRTAEIEDVTAMIKDIYTRGLIKRREKNMLEKAINISASKLREVVVYLIGVMTAEIKEEEEIESVPHIIRFITDAVRAQALANRDYKDIKNITAEELIRTLESFLAAMTEPATYDINVVLEPDTYTMLDSLYKCESPPVMSSVSVRVKGVFVLEGQELPGFVSEFLKDIQEDHHVIVYKGSEALAEFAKSSKGTFVVVGRGNQDIDEEVNKKKEAEINHIIIKTTSEGAVIVSPKKLSFSYPENKGYDEAVDISPVAKGKMVMLYQDNPIMKPGQHLASVQIERYNLRGGPGGVMICIGYSACGEN